MQDQSEKEKRSGTYALTLTAGDPVNVESVLQSPFSPRFNESLDKRRQTFERRNFQSVENSRFLSQSGSRHSIPVSGSISNPKLTLRKQYLGCSSFRTLLTQ